MHKYNIGEQDSMYNAALYARISREDGDKNESDSISNQRELIKEYVKNKSNIRLVSERIDDGYSGVTLDRPALNAMLDDVRNGYINCIIVKDLSRFGRNYIEVGRYIRTLFPLLGVRFIAINDGYDSAAEHSPVDDYIIPFKNIINDAYCADISKKIRSQFEIKRKKGDFISPFAPFGYLKSPENRNKLIVDDIASEVVKDIFKDKLAGMSCQSIADKLNFLGVLSPLEYKKSIGLKFTTSFKVNPKAKWSANSVKRILTDEIYTGVLLQGKTTTPNYKVKQKIIKDKSEWERAQNTHEAIISSEEFELAADLLGRDTYKTKNYPFSSVLFCSKCGHNLIRKVSTVDGVKYINHACIKNHKNGKRAGCSGIRVKESELYHIVASALKNHINSILELDDILRSGENTPQKEFVIQKLQKQINMKRDEADKLETRKVRLYEDFTDGDITRIEYASFRKNYDTQIAETETVLENLIREFDALTNEKSETNNKRLEYFREHQNFAELTREVVVKFIDRIIVYEGGGLNIIYRYKDEFERIITEQNALYTLSNITDTEEYSEVHI